MSRVTERALCIQCSCVNLDNDLHRNLSNEEMTDKIHINRTALMCGSIYMDFIGQEPAVVTLIDCPEFFIFEYYAVFA